MSVYWGQSHWFSIERTCRIFFFIWFSFNCKSFVQSAQDFTGLVLILNWKWQWNPLRQSWPENTYKKLSILQNILSFILFYFFCDVHWSAYVRFTKQKGLLSWSKSWLASADVFISTVTTSTQWSYILWWSKLWWNDIFGIKNFIMW